MQRFYLKIEKGITMFLTLILVMLSITMPSTAGAKQAEIRTDPSFENSEYLPDHLIEMESLREEKVKHYKLPDGSYEAIVYNQPVHRKDSNGNWMDINNQLKESDKFGQKSYITDDERVVFSKTITSTGPKIFSLAENGYSIDVSLVNDDIKTTTAKLSNHPDKYIPERSDSIETQKVKIKTIDNNSSITYRNVVQGIDLDYELTGNDIKERIIVRQQYDVYEYVFLYDLKGLIAKMCDDGTIGFCDEETNEFVYQIPAPYMYDAAGMVSTDVEYTLDYRGNNTYVLTVIADDEWINQDDRAFPVIIDPTIQMPAAIYDTYVISSYPTTNYGTSKELWVGTAQTTYLKHRQLVNLPNNATINSAVLNMNYYYHISTGSVTIGVYEVVVPWTETSLTWENARQNDNMGLSSECIGTAIASASTSISETAPGMVSFDLTNLVQKWYAGHENNGIALKYHSSVNKSVVLMSYESGAETRAYYEIGYTYADLPIQNGKYYIKNMKFDDAFVQLDDVADDTEDGVKFELRSFNGEANQTWEFEYLHNGFYKIISCSSQKAASVPEEKINTNNAVLEQETYSALERQQWRITATNDGMFKISPRTCSDYYMACSTSILGSSGRNIQQRTAQSDYKDEWSIVSIYDFAILKLNARIYFSPSVSTKYSSDELVSMYQSAVEDFYWCFNIAIKNQSIASSNELLLGNECKTSGICNVGCGSLSSCNSQHHKSASLFNNKLKSSSYYTCRFVDFRMCYYDAKDGHKEVRGLANVKGKNATVTTGAVGMTSEDVIYVIQHELTHNLGQAHEKCTPKQPCVLEGDVGFWCDACTASIKKLYQ